MVGPNFIAVHTMLDPQVDAVRPMVDALAERIATLGGSPVGTPGALVTQRSWDDYAIGRAQTNAHLAALQAGSRLLSLRAGTITAPRHPLTPGPRAGQSTAGRR
ncbi:Dps family protein [Paractinoplanes globisporus]|uniref:Dps family protein n=1 Tax=Paractinoplanes globisporus TaxID=113565 RepID=A0ABW6WFH2_9ACTN|nr:ferritin-like domain-containing protein [Actinoplanes globisporus]